MSNIVLNLLKLNFKKFTSRRPDFRRTYQLDGELAVHDFPKWGVGGASSQGSETTKNSSVGGLMTFGYRLGLGKAGCQGNHLKKMHPKPSRLAPAIFKNKFPAKGLEIRRANGDSRRQAGNLRE